MLTLAGPCAGSESEASSLNDAAVNLPALVPAASDPDTVNFLFSIDVQDVFGTTASFVSTWIAVKLKNTRNRLHVTFNDDQAVSVERSMRKGSRVCLGRNRPRLFSRDST